MLFALSPLGRIVGLPLGLVISEMSNPNCFGHFNAITTDLHDPVANRRMKLKGSTGCNEYTVSVEMRGLIEKNVVWHERGRLIKEFGYLDRVRLTGVRMVALSWRGPSFIRWGFIPLRVCQSVALSVSLSRCLSVSLAVFLHSVRRFERK